MNIYWHMHEYENVRTHMYVCIYNSVFGNTYMYIYLAIYGGGARGGPGAEPDGDRGHLPPLNPPKKSLYFFIMQTIPLTWNK